jgi:hypothetical protein
VTDPLPNLPAPRPAFSIPSIVAAIAAFLSFKAGAIFGLLLAIAAIVLGLLGLFLALSPRVRGGIVSVISIVAGLIGIIAAAFKLIGGNW